MRLMNFAFVKQRFYILLSFRYAESFLETIKKGILIYFYKIFFFFNYILKG